jgi:hypothetical protein
MEKKYLSKADSARYLNITIKEFEKIKCLGLIKEYKLFNLPRFWVRDLAYYNEHLRENERDD